MPVRAAIIRSKYVEIECLDTIMSDGLIRADAHCRFPVRIGSHSGDGDNKTWGWDGNMEAPTITPSINCLSCGAHVIITGGVINGYPEGPYKMMDHSGGKRPCSIRRGAITAGDPAMFAEDPIVEGK